jgi:hypothetical protein
VCSSILGVSVFRRFECAWRLPLRNCSLTHKAWRWRHYIPSRLRAVQSPWIALTWRLIHYDSPKRRWQFTTLRSLNLQQHRCENLKSLKFIQGSSRWVLNQYQTFVSTIQSGKFLGKLSDCQICFMETTRILGRCCRLIPVIYRRSRRLHLHTSMFTRHL